MPKKQATVYVGCKYVDDHCELSGAFKDLDDRKCMFNGDTCAPKRQGKKPLVVIKEPVKQRPPVVPPKEKVVAPEAQWKAAITKMRAAGRAKREAAETVQFQKNPEIAVLRKQRRDDAWREPLSPAVAEAAVAQTSASKQRLSKVPSLVDLAGAESDDFMLVMETWPNTRTDILEMTRIEMNARFKAEGSRTISKLAKWFAFLERVGHSSVYGEVFRACLRAWETHTKPASPVSCLQYEMRLPGAASASRHSVSLIVKTLKPFTQKLLGDVPYSGHDAAFQKWVGNKNTVREVMMGRLLNLLVTLDVTPHLPIIYEPFYIEEKNANGFAMEMAHLSFSNFLESTILLPKTNEEALELLDVAILQICNGLLCAQKHYDFRHNDFHAENAMMTYITDTTYNYKVNGSFYKIPNYGMCWKPIDFGFTSSTVFDHHDPAHLVMHSFSLESLDDVEGSLSVHAMEFFDLIRLCTYAEQEVMRRGRPSTRKRLIKEALRGYVELMGKISIESAEMGSLAKARAVYAKNIVRSTKTLKPASVHFSRLMRSSGLLDTFFETLAARYKVKGKPHGVVFDANVSPFAHGNIILEGIHKKLITVIPPPKQRRAF